MVNSDKPQPAGMTLGRMACFVLGTIGVLIGILVGLGAKNWFIGMLLGGLLGIPLVMAWAAWPRRWFTAVDKGPDSLYRSYTRIELWLLAAMVLVGALLCWLLPQLPASITGGAGVGTVVGAVALTLASSVYAWQLKASLRRGGVVGPAMLLVFGALMAADREDLGSGMQLYGYSLIYMGFWSLVRVAAFRLLDRHGSSVVATAAPVVAQPQRKSLIRTMPVTMAIVVVLCAIYVLELVFNIGPMGPLLAPSLHTVVAFGALYHPALLQDQQWYRLLSPALLHVNLIHLFFNCYALILIGLMLERFIGRPWFLAIFVLGSIGGSLMSLAIDPPQLISLGASGAIMAQFGAALATSLRRTDPKARAALQKWLIQVLVLSLLPLINFGGGRIDIAAHLGGVLTGGLLGLIIWATWDTQEQKPRFTRFATAVAALGVMGFLYTAIPALQHYPDYVQDAQIQTAPQK